jgi:cytidylate kinase
MLNIAPGTKITITGDLGSGKSAISRILCERTGFEYISTGRVQRQLALELGIDTLEMNRRADTDPSIDERIDGIFVDLGNDPNGYIIDSRMAWFFLPNSFKIYLQTDVEVAVQRIMNDPNRADSEQYQSPEEAAKKILARKASENARFLSKYGADCANLDNFDLVINTANRTQAEVAEVIFDVLEGRNQGKEMKRFW